MTLETAFFFFFLKEGHITMMTLEMVQCFSSLYCWFFLVRNVFMYGNH